MAVTKEETKSFNISIKVGWLGLLTLIMFVLKLDPGNHLSSDVENWSWWLVFIVPISGIALLVLIGVVAAVIFGGAALLDAIDRAKRRRKQKKIAAMTPEERNEYYRAAREKNRAQMKRY